jgi:hypothetical protein
MKRFIALFLVISFLGMHCATYERGEGLSLEPGQKPGVNLVFWKLDWQQVEGELIAVRGDSLLIKESESGTDVSVDIKDIRTIKIGRDSNLLSSFGFGLIIGAGFGAAIGWSGTPGKPGWGDPFHYDVTENIKNFGIFFGLIGALIGVMTGAAAGKDKTIQIEGKSDTELKEILKDLHKKARVPDFQ